MNLQPESRGAEPRMDAAALYKEELFTDRKAGILRRLSPVKSDGSPDAGRKTLFIGEAQLLTSAGALPLSFEIPAASLEEAAGKYAEAVKEAYQDAVAEINELRRRAASSPRLRARASLPRPPSLQEARQSNPGPA